MIASKSASMMRFGARTFSRNANATRAWANPTTAKNTAIRLSTSSAPPAPAKKTLTFTQGLAGGLLLAGLHSATGSQNEFYDYRYTTNKDPDDLASFFGGEELMELFCVFPFVGHIMMRNGEFDEKGDVITQGFPGTMKVSMVFSDETNGDTIEWFNKRERFHNTLFGLTMWDQVSNFGFRTLEDGTIQCYHYGEYFHGPLPIVSQVVLLVFKIHARWVAWATEHHINHFAFTAETEEEEEWEEESRKQMPIFLLKHFFLVDLKAMIFGVKEEDENVHHDNSPSFLVRRGSADEMTSEKLPIQRQGTLIKIHQDIEADRAAVKSTLAKAATQSDEDAKVVLARTYTMRTGDDMQPSSAYGAAMEAARSHHMARRGSLRESMTTRRGTLKPKKAVAKEESDEHTIGRRSSSVGA